MRLLLAHVVFVAMAAGLAASAGDASIGQTATAPESGPVTVEHNDHALPVADRDETLARIAEATRTVDALNDQLIALEHNLSQVEIETRELRQEISVLSEETLRDAIDVYRDRYTPSAMLEADELADAMRSAALGRAAVSSDTENFDRYRSLLKDLELGEAEVTARQQQVDDIKADIAVVDEELITELLWLGELEERRIQSDAATASIQASIRAQNRGRKQGFYLATCPINGPHDFVDSWGFARSGGRRHKGVDMLAESGIEVVAPVSGVVEHATNNLGGRVFRLVGDDGNYFYGAHLSEFGKQGPVRAGEIIGYIGDSGNAAGINHLHFEIHPGGRGNPLNPFIDTASVCSGAR